ncbi:MAG: hypothetical protein ACM3QS_11475 [Bacteroidota bacterium]
MFSFAAPRAQSTIQPGARTAQDNIILYVLAGLALLGVLFTRRYGESWDELKFYKYADDALRAYVTWPTTGSIPVMGDTYDNYGPAYVMAVALVARGLHLFVPWLESDLRHLLYFFTFLAGLWAFYRLGRRWLRPPAALGATALFAAQPVFWGHAFISPKDIPFLVLFVFALHFGFRAFDGIEPPAFHALPARTRRLLLILTGAWIVSLLLLVGGTTLWHSWLESTVRAAAAGQDNLLARLASDIHKVDPAVYIQKYFLLFIRARLVFILLASALLFLFYRRFWPDALRLLRALLLPALFLGLTTCVRVLGPLAGLLVALYAFSRLGRRAVPLLLVYAFLAFIAMYAVWPYLWPDPVGHFIESFIVMAKYPWRGQVLFNGVLYASSAIPRSYLPVLLAIQMTEPVWFLFIAGLIVTILAAAKRQVAAIQLLVLTGIWFLLPALGFVALRSPLYDNFRQIFFILPPVFLMAGVVFEKITSAAWRTALVLLCLLPGVIAGVRLHPYEYIYYNAFVGGEAGAFRRFELDYWGTSYREAAQWLNAGAPPNASIWVDGPSHLLGMYLRPDLKLYSAYEADRLDHYDYSVSTSRYDLDLTSYPDASVVHAISREGAILTVIKQPRGTASARLRLPPAMRAGMKEE